MPPRGRRKAARTVESQAQSQNNEQEQHQPEQSIPNAEARQTNLLLELIQGLQQTQGELAEAVRQLKEKSSEAKNDRHDDENQHENPHQEPISHNNKEEPFITLSEVADLLQQEREKILKEPRHFVKKPPYPAELLKQPYPDKVLMPVMETYAYESFPSPLTIEHIHGTPHCLPGSVRSWDDMVEMFCGKYFQAEEKVTLVNLHGTKQGNGEDLLKYIHRFHDMALDCYANYEESELIGICINNMTPEFRAHLENLDISRFAQLLQKARKTALSVRPYVEKTREKKYSPQTLTVSAGDDKRRKKFVEMPPPVPCTREEMITILNKRFHARIQDGTLELPQTQQRVHIDPFLKHKGKATVSVIIHGSTSNIDMSESAATNPAMTPAAIRALQRNSKFRSLFDQLGLNPEARMAAMEAIMSIAAESGTHCFTAETHASHAFLETTNAITFTDEDMDVPYPDHRRPLYLAATINEVQVRRALVPCHRLRVPCPAGIDILKYRAVPIGPGARVLSQNYLKLEFEFSHVQVSTAANPTPFDQSESHFVEVSLYDEITLAGEASLSKPVGTPLPRWEDIRDDPEVDLRELLERKKKHKEEASTSKNQPQCWTKKSSSELSAVTEETIAADPRISAKEELEVIDLSSDPSIQRPISINASLSASERTQLGGIIEGPMRTFHPEVEAQISQEVQKLLSVGFIKPIQHPRWLSNIVPVTATFAPLLKKGVPFRWSLECQQSFERVQDIMAKLPTVCAPIFGKPLRLYLASNNQAIGALIAQEGNDGVEQPIYYVSRTLKDAETRYSGAERSCLALIYASQRLRHYFLASQNLANDEISSHQKSAATASCADWQTCTVAAAVPGEVNEVLMADVTDATWTLRFDGSSTAASSGAGIEPSLAPYRALAQKLEEKFATFEIEHAQRNENRYADALATLGSQMAFEGQKIDITINKKAKPITELLKEDRLQGNQGLHLDIKLVKEEEKISLYRRLQRLGYYWPNMSREAADLQSQCSTCQLQHDNEEVYAIFASTDWRVPFLEYFLEGILPQTHKEVYRLKRLASRYFVEGRTLFRKGYHGEPLWCLSISESQMVMKEAHAGECGEHQGKKRLYQRLLTLGYYWPTMKKDTADFVKTCHTCQVQADLIHTHPTNLQNMTTPWPFHTWGLDLIGPIGPASDGHIWILVATEYFTKWVEAVSLPKGHCNWNSHLADVLWAYRSSPKTATGFTPFSLVYDLEGLDESRELARLKSQRNYQKMANAYSKTLKVRIFAEGQLVLKAADFVRRGLPSPSKFSPNWEGPYLIREAHGSGYYKLSKSDGTTLADPINGKMAQALLFISISATMP
uniref:Integrase zinc-binding domain-containing protein n=1 Tax=Fagus sylvatica TaxID=28930 RepID=A0A2N9F1A7_FAGSY